MACKIGIGGGRGLGRKLRNQQLRRDHARPLRIRRHDWRRRRRHVGEAQPRLRQRHRLGRRGRHFVGWRECHRRGRRRRRKRKLRGRRERGEPWKRGNHDGRLGNGVGLRRGGAWRGWRKHAEGLGLALQRQALRWRARWGRWPAASLHRGLVPRGGPLLLGRLRGREGSFPEFFTC